ncbi:MAG: UDP-N-acetylglucosamine 1-carboxyvinyltransferase [Rhodothermales bacterium]
MEKLVITGGRTLQGSLTVGGSKNTALALLTGALLPEGTSTIANVPHVRDVRTLAQILEFTGAKVEIPDAGPLVVHAEDVSFPEAPYELVKKMRASFYMLGALLGRFGTARVSLPGGCAWGPRPVDLHIEGIKALGAEIDLEQGYVIARAPHGRLPGGTFRLEPSSVGATINLLLAAVRATGSSRIENAASEPDVIVFGEALQQMGAKIAGLGTRTIEIEGVDTLHPAAITNCPDRIELGTFMIAAAVTGPAGGSVRILNAEHRHLGDAFKEALAEAGVRVEYGDNELVVWTPEVIHPIDIETAIYPGFPTDLQAQWTVLMAKAAGTSRVTDTIYFDRFKHIPELERMGLRARVEGNTVTIKGGQQLKGAQVMSSDLRASVSLVLAGLIAKGETHVLRVYHLDRGYENLEAKLRTAGIAIYREQYDEFALPEHPEG